MRYAEESVPQPRTSRFFSKSNRVKSTLLGVLALTSAFAAHKFAPTTTVHNNYQQIAHETTSVVEHSTPDIHIVQPGENASRIVSAYHRQEGRVLSETELTTAVNAVADRSPISRHQQDTKIVGGLLGQDGRKLDNIHPGDTLELGNKVHTTTVVTTAYTVENIPVTERAGSLPITLLFGGIAIIAGAGAISSSLRRGDFETEHARALANPISTTVKPNTPTILLFPPGYIKETHQPQTVQKNVRSAIETIVKKPVASFQYAQKRVTNISAVVASLSFIPQPLGDTYHEPPHTQTYQEMNFRTNPVNMRPVSEPRHSLDQAVQAYQFSNTNVSDITDGLGISKNKLYSALDARNILSRKTIQQNNIQQRAYQTQAMFAQGNKTVQEIARDQCVSTSTVYRDLNRKLDEYCTH